jgi:hypothetical protein
LSKSWPIFAASRGRGNLAVLRIGLPLKIGDAERLEQRLPREGFERFAGDLFNDVAEQIRAAAIVGPERVRRRCDRLGQDIADRIGIEGEMRLVVVGMGPGQRLVPFDA